MSCHNKIVLVIMLVAFQAVVSGCSGSIKPYSSAYIDGNTVKDLASVKYDFYALLLVPSDVLYNKYTDEEWKRIDIAFQSLGQSFGDKGAAVTYAKHRKSYIGKVFSRDGSGLDKSRRIVQMFNKYELRPLKRIDPEKFIVVAYSSYNPLTEPGPDDYFTAIAWRDVSANDVINVFGDISSYVRNGTMSEGTLEMDKLVEIIKMIIKDYGSILSIVGWRK